MIKPYHVEALCKFNKPSKKYCILAEVIADEQRGAGMWKPFSRGDSLYVWNHVAQDGDSFLRIFFVKSLSLSHGSKADVRRRFSQLTEVLQVSLEPNYWSVRCNSAPSVELLGMMRNALGEHQGWSAEKTVKMQMLEITSVGDYRAMIKQYPRAGWNLKEGD